MSKHEEMREIRRKWNDTSVPDSGMSLFLQWAHLTQEYRVVEAHCRFIAFVTDAEDLHDGQT